MKVMKTMKKLKFWSRKKRKKKTHFWENPPLPPRLPPPPPPLYCNCHWQCHHPVQPSAPPLPEWLEYEQSEEAILISEVNTSSAGLYNSSEAQFVPQQQNTDSEISHEYPTSYQQYMIQNPVYGIPAVNESTEERAGGAFGYVFNILCCLFPCFKPDSK
ncbi:hypothetical protein Adt_44023 [Abeliophyllum distichum]|uniref:Uncharacterized protein n=1 Tax=Abeliophyllum distichum TaxID=126358 RepID=A0ABD1P9N4_9LAMI